jgi:hypothetical protein
MIKLLITTGITRNNLLQINATILAGLLILFTIQSVTTDSFVDRSYSYTLLGAEDKILKDIQDGIDKAKATTKKDYDNKDENGVIVLETLPTENSGEISFVVPIPLHLLEETEAKVSSMQAENYIERITLQAKFDASKDQHTTIFLYTNPQFVVSILIIPFTLSMVFEMAFTIWNRSKIEPSYISLGFFILGLIIMLVMFSIIFISHVNSF